MNRIEEQLNTLERLRDITLPDEARARMRAELLSYAELHAVPAAGKTRSIFTPLRFRMYAGLSAAAFLIVALGGTAYASEKALPGDTLYPVKIGLAEPLQTALIPSDRGRATWHAILAERRLDETAELAAEGKLSTSTQDELAANFSDQVSASQESADRLQHDGDTAGSLSARSDLEARLAAHLQILAVIDQHYATASSTDGVDTHAALSRMLAIVADHEEAITSSRIALEDQIAPDGAQDDQAGDDASSTVIAAAIPAPETHKEKAEEAAVAPLEETPAAEIETTASARTTEVEDILERHAALLAAFLPPASTTATSTASTTTTTTNPTLQNAPLDETASSSDAP